MRVFLLLLSVLFSLSVAAQNTLTYPPGTVDDLILVEGAQALMQSARADNVRPTADGSAIELVDGALAGSLTIPAVTSRFPFNEAIPSWNGWSPKDGGFRVWMNPLLQNRAPSAWFDAGTWGRVTDELTTRVIPLNCGIYNIDTLLLNTPAVGVALRFDLVRASSEIPSPKIFMFALSYSNSMGDHQLARQFGVSRRGTPDSAQVNVPFRSQVIERDSWIGRICSPASVNMALANFGIRKDTQTVASDLYDPVCDAFGVWHRSVQGASQEGIRGYITRFRNWNDVSSALAQGHVVCASIRFGAGEVDDPMVRYGRRKKGTEGHLILLTGIKSDGTVTVHDTASKDYGVNSVWRQEELAKAWFDKGGVAYVFTGPRDRALPDPR
jgi:hypothetical protein